MTELERICNVVKQVHFPGYEFDVVSGGELYSIQVSYMEKDIETGKMEKQTGRMWVFPAGQTDGQIVGTCFKAIMTSMEHRTREYFSFAGKAVFCPHMNIDYLWNIAPSRSENDEPIEIG